MFSSVALQYFSALYKWHDFREKSYRTQNVRFDFTLQPFLFLKYFSFYRGADKFLARPGRKQATATEDFDVHISYL